MPLPPLPPLPRVTRADKKREVRARNMNMKGPEVGRWEPTGKREDDEGGAWIGRCGFCGRVRPAIELEPRIPPFGTKDEEQWACKDGCEQ